MLVLGRREGEAIYIGDYIILRVTKIEGGAVRIGIDAPPDIRILREELVPYDETKQLKKS